MIAALSRRQIANGQLRTMGIRPSFSYHWHVLPGDRVRVQVVQQEPAVVAMFLAHVEGVEHHGHYSLVSYVREDTGEHCSGWLHHDGPPDWGIVEFRVVEPVPRLQPEEEEELKRDRDDMLKPLSSPERCPICRARYDYIPRDGWPCIVCRVAAVSAE